MKHRGRGLTATALMLGAIIGLQHCFGKNHEPKSITEKVELKTEGIQKPKKVEKVPETAVHKKGEEEVYNLVWYCTFNTGSCANELNEGDRIFDTGTHKVFEGAGLKSVFIDKVGDNEVKIRIYTKKNPVEPIMLELKFGETKEIGEGEKIKIRAEKGAKPKTIEVTLNTKNASESGQTTKKKIFNEWPGD
jgi:hypothetical protein